MKCSNSSVLTLFSVKSSRTTVSRTDETGEIERALRAIHAQSR